MSDNLESYFKKHLSDETPGKENWNVPSDDVWNKVLPKIQKKKGFFIPWRYFYLIGLLLVIGIIAIFWFINKSDTTLEDKNAIDNIPDAKVVQVAEPTKKINDNNQSINTETDNNEELNRNNQNLKTTVNLDNQKNNFELKNNTISNDEDPHKNQIVFEKEDEIEIEPSSPKSTNLEISTLHFKTFTQLSSVNMEPIMVQIPLKNNETIIPFFMGGNIVSAKEPFDNKGKFGIGAFFIPTLNTTYLSGELTNGVLETSNVYLYSNNWGFELKYFISKRFTLLIGIEKSENKSWSKSIIDFEYDSSTEHLMPTGEKENISPVPMQTPFGEIDTEITYRFPGDQVILNGDVMLSAMETHQELRYLSIPLGIEYNIIPFSRFNWFAEGGIRYNHAIKDANDFSSRIVHDGHDMDVVGEEIMNHPTYTENYLNYYIGTGINYQISKSFQINVSARYFNSITEVNLQDNLSTYVRGFSLKLGIVYIY